MESVHVVVEGEGVTTISSVRQFSEELIAAKPTQDVRVTTRAIPAGFLAAGEKLMEKQRRRLFRKQARRRALRKMYLYGRAVGMLGGGVSALVGMLIAFFLMYLCK